MQFLPNLLTALILILPVTVKDVVKPAGLDHASRGQIDVLHVLCHKVHRRAEYPTPESACIGGWDEIALSEEDSSELVSLNLLPQVRFVEVRSSALCLRPFSLPHSCAAAAPAGSILRC
jgi:hypothetical protein